MKNVIVKNLKYKYPNSDKFALDDINFSLSKGDFLSVVGSNGSGKSTLLYALSGLIPHFFKGSYGGDVFIYNKSILENPLYETTKRVSIVFQNPLNQLSGAKRTVYEEVAFGLENKGVPSDKMDSIITEVLTEMDIYHLKDQNPFTLSGGQMQRLAIASIMALKPEILLFDEPASQLDPAGTEYVFEAIKKLSDEGMTIVLATHKLEYVCEFSNKVIILKDSKQLAFDTPEKIFGTDNVEVAKPIYSKVCKQLDKKTKEGLYPITFSQTLETL